jgi:hypothetical protein
MPRISLRSRALALLPLAAVGLHQLRYELAFGSHAGPELATEGHAYLASLTPLLALVAALLVAELLTRFARAWHGQGEGFRNPPAIVLGLAIAASLVAIYSGQELLEGLLATGHPAGLAGVFGGGGWWSVPLALAFGLLIALLLRGAEAAIALVARLRSRAGRPPSVAAPRPAPRSALIPSPRPFAGSAPSRAPPLSPATR